MTFFRKAWIIARKDILTELRSREMLSSMGAFAVLIILLFAFALLISEVSQFWYPPSRLHDAQVPLLTAEDSHSNNDQ